MAVQEDIVVGFEFDRDAVWDRIQGRKAVYLDMNVWIDLADGMKPEVQPVKEKLQERVRAGNLFCPLFPSLLWELYKQESSRLRTGALMEELSLNVSFAMPKEVFDWEVTRLAKRLAGQEDSQCARKMLFVPLVGYIASWGSFRYPAGSDATYVRDSSKMLFDRLNSLGLTELLSLKDDGSIASIFKNMAPLPFQQQAVLFQQFAKGDRSKVRLVEEQSVVTSYVLPVIDKLDNLLVPALARSITEAPADRYGGRLPTLLAELPAIQNHIEAMTRNSEDPNRKDRVSDFFDLDMLSVPPAYSDVFVTNDKWVRERFLKPGGFLKRSGCVFCSSYAELNLWLDNHV